MAGPSGIERDACAVGEANKRRGEIIDIELGVRRAVRQAPAAFAQAPVAELGVGRADDRHGLEIVHRVKAKVEHVHADVVERSAACDFHVSKPGAEFRNSRAAAPVGLRVVDFAERALLDERLDLLRIGREALIHADVENESAFFGEVNRLFGFRRVHGEGLFEQHVLARLERLHGEGNMKFIRDRNVNCIDRLVGQEFLDLLMRKLERMFFLQRLDALQVEVLNGDQLGIGVAEDGVCGVVGDCSSPDQAKANSR